MKGRPSTINKSHLSEFINLCLSGLTRKQAADELGFSLAGIRVSLKKHNLKAPRKSLIDQMEKLQKVVYLLILLLYQAHIKIFMLFI